MTGSHVAIHAAIEQQRKEREEEEDMTHYTSDDLDQDWEFKIVRSTFGSFRRPQMLQDLIEEESQAGWEMIEKFDEYRVRFKRPRSARRNDVNLPSYIDPYRTQYGVGRQNLIVIGLVVMLGLFVAGLVVFLFLAG